MVLCYKKIDSSQCNFYSIATRNSYLMSKERLLLKDCFLIYLGISNYKRYTGAEIFADLPSFLFSSLILPFPFVLVMRSLMDG